MKQCKLHPRADEPYIVLPKPDPMRVVDVFLAMTDEEIVSSFDGKEGVEDFVRIYVRGFRLDKRVRKVQTIASKARIALSEFKEAYEGRDFQIGESLYCYDERKHKRFLSIEFYD